MSHFDCLKKIVIHGGTFFVVKREREKIYWYQIKKYTRSKNVRQSIKR
jgi:hypothetical protein